ncbi:MAG: DUF1573 domain-containing protein [Planctomycetes bacterium]|nr:DUF1573 domain-containing protein [Planctomycetota bacterium]
MSRRQVLSVAAIGGAIVGAYAVGNRHSIPSSPKAKVAPSAGYVGFHPGLIDAGKHPWYAEVPFEAVFVNDSAEPLTVATIGSSCGCIVLDRGSPTDAVVPAGQELRLAGTLDVGPVAGEHTKKIDLLLSSGAIHTVFLKFFAYQTYDVRPRYLKFDAVNLDDETDDAIASVIFTSDTATFIEEPVTDSPWLQAGLHDRRNGETEIAVRVVKRNLPYGKNFGRVTLATDDPTRPAFTIPIHAEGVAQLRPVPSHVFLRAGEERQVRFILADGATARIASFSADNDALAVALVPDNGALAVSVARGHLTSAALVCVEDERGKKSKFLVSCVE